MTEELDEDNRYIKANVISVGNLVEGIKDKDVSNLKLIKDQNYDELSDKIINNFIKNLEI